MILIFLFTHFSLNWHVSIRLTSKQSGTVDLFPFLLYLHQVSFWQQEHPGKQHTQALNHAHYRNICSDQRMYVFHSLQQYSKELRYWHGLVDYGQKGFWNCFQKFANPCDETNGFLVDVKRFVTKLGHKSSNLEKLKKARSRS